MANKGFLLVLMDCPPTLEDEFNAWYDSEHLPERLAVPGFLTAIRFVCLDGHPKYLAMYDLERFDVLQSPAYKKVGYGNASPWTKRVTSRVKVYRSAGDQVFPGNAITKRAPRITLLRFTGLGADAERDLIAGLKANLEGLPGTGQGRVLAYDTGGGKRDYLVLVEWRSTAVGAVDVASFARHADAIDLMNTYAPH